MPRPTNAELTDLLTESQSAVFRLREAIIEEQNTTATVRRSLEESRLTASEHASTRQSTQAAIAQHLAVEHKVEVDTDDAEHNESRDVTFLVWLREQA